MRLGERIKKSLFSDIPDESSAKGRYDDSPDGGVTQEAIARDTGGPAFPFALIDFSQGKQEDLPGMTLRDYFAGQALIELSMQLIVGEEQPSDLARVAYAMADAMLTERIKL